MSKGNKRPRAERRMRERAERKLVRDRERLVALEVGGSAGRPIEVDTPAVIPGRVRSTPCHQCGGPLADADSAAVTVAAGRRRRARTRCRRCHTERELWFVIGRVAN